MAFMLTAISGTILVYRPEIISLSLDAKTPDYKKIGEEDAVKAITELTGPDINFIDFPMKDAPWYRVWTWNGTISYYDPTTLKKMPVKYHMTEIMIFLSDLHIHFLCNKCGQTHCMKDMPVPKMDLAEGFSFENANFVVKGICPNCR